MPHSKQIPNQRLSNYDHILFIFLTKIPDNTEIALNNESQRGAFKFNNGAMQINLKKHIHSVNWWLLHELMWKWWERNLGEVDVFVERPVRGTIMVFATVVMQARHFHSSLATKIKIVDPFLCDLVFITSTRQQESSKRRT